MPESFFSEKALTAIKKNFRAVKLKPSVVRQRAVDLLLRHNLERIACNVKKAKSLTLELLFQPKHIRTRFRFEQSFQSKAPGKSLYLVICRTA